MFPSPPFGREFVRAATIGVFVDWHAPCLRSLCEFAPENGTVTCDSCARRELTDNDGVTVGSSMDGIEFYCVDIAATFFGFFRSRRCCIGLGAVERSE